MNGVNASIAFLPVSGQSPENGTCHVAGWGTFYSGSDQPNKLHYVDVNIFEDEYISNIAYGDAFDNATMTPFLGWTHFCTNQFSISYSLRRPANQDYQKIIHFYFLHQKRLKSRMQKLYLYLS